MGTSPEPLVNPLRAAWDGDDAEAELWGLNFFVLNNVKDDNVVLKVAAVWCSCQAQEQDTEGE